MTATILPKGFTLTRNSDESEDAYTIRLLGWACIWLNDSMTEEDLPEGVPREIFELYESIKQVDTDEIMGLYQDALYCDDFKRKTVDGAWCRAYLSLLNEEWIKRTK